MQRVKAWLALLLCLLLIGACTTPAFAAELPAVLDLPVVGRLLLILLRLVNYLRFALAVLPPPVF